MAIQKKPKKYLLDEIKNEIKERNEPVKIQKEVEKITKKLLNKFNDRKNVGEFFKNVEIEIIELTRQKRKDTRQIRVKILVDFLLYVKDWITNNHSEWKEDRPEYNKIFKEYFPDEQANKLKHLKKEMRVLEEIFNNPNTYILGLMSLNEKFSRETKRDSIKKLKTFFNQHPEASELANGSVKENDEWYDNKIKNLENEIKLSILDKITLYKDIIYKNNQLIKQTDNVKKNEELKIMNKDYSNKIEDLEYMLKNKKTASQKYTNEDFKQYEELNPECGYNGTTAFYKLQEVTTNEDIKKTTYKSFRTAYNSRAK